VRLPAPGRCRRRPPGTAQGTSSASSGTRSARGLSRRRRGAAGSEAGTGRRGPGSEASTERGRDRNGTGRSPLSGSWILKFFAPPVYPEPKKHEPAIVFEAKNSPLGPRKTLRDNKKPRAIKTKTGAGSEAGRKRAWGPQGAPGPLAGLPPLFCSSRDFCFCARVFFPLSHSVFRGPGGKFLASKTIVRSCFCGSGRGAWKRCVFPDLVDFGRF